MEVAKKCPEEIANYLLEQFDLDAEHLYYVDGPVNLARFISNFDLPELRYKPYQQVLPQLLYTKNRFLMC